MRDRYASSSSDEGTSQTGASSHHYDFGSQSSIELEDTIIDPYRSEMPRYVYPTDMHTHNFLHIPPNNMQTPWRCEVTQYTYFPNTPNYFVQPAPHMPLTPIPAFNPHAQYPPSPASTADTYGSDAVFVIDSKYLDDSPLIDIPKDA
ncbi:hypothetical protein PMAYCL1PPCAC_09252, partial [Pristionchus mayeri]